MMRWTLALACSLALVAPAAAAYRSCYLADQVCASYDWAPGNSYADAEVLGILAGAGQYSTSEYRGLGAHAFTPGTWVSAYDGAWYGDTFTLVSLGVNGKEYVWYYQNDQASAHPGAYHCMELGGNVYERCGTGLP